VSNDLHIRGYTDEAVFDAEHSVPSVVQYVPNEGYIQTGAEIGVRFMQKEIL